MPLCRSPLTLRLALFSRSRTAAVEIPRFILHRRRSEFLPEGGNKRSTGGFRISNLNRLPDGVPGGFSVSLGCSTAGGASHQPRLLFQTLGARRTPIKAAEPRLARREMRPVSLCRRGGCVRAGQTVRKIQNQFITNRKNRQEKAAFFVIFTI